MKNCLVIGGGIVGLTAASILTAKNIPVTLLEASPKLGGRTYSFYDEIRKCYLDNGQHILMGCYKETLSLLRLIDAIDYFTYQKNLKINFICENKKNYTLNADKLFYPINLLLAFLNYDVLSFIDKIKFAGFIVKIPFFSKRSLSNKSVIDWLLNENQTDELIKNFWEIVCVGAMNTSLEKASAIMFQKILFEIFFKGNFASTIVLPKYGLTETIINPAENFITSNGGIIHKSTSVRKIVIKENKVEEVLTDNMSFKNFDFVISAIPLYALDKIVELKELDIDLDLKYSTILNIHLWLSENDFSEKFYGLLNSPLHWIFIKENHINIVISNADYLVDSNQEEILNMVIYELVKYTSITKEMICDYKIIKEKRATFVPDVNTKNSRPSAKTNINNFFLAGDWIGTGLPATIESAALSGRVAADLVIRRL